jgi:hypothetical protein
MIDHFAAPVERYPVHEKRGFGNFTAMRSEPADNLTFQALPHESVIPAVIY